MIHGRLFDLQGQPARDVKLSVTAIRRVLPTASNPPFENFEGPAFAWTHPDDLPGWPSPAITGADGRFILHGVGPGLRVYLSMVDPRFASEVIEINTDAASAAQPVELRAPTRQDHHRSRDLCRHRQAGPACPGDAQRGRPEERRGGAPDHNRSRCRGAVPCESPIDPWQAS